MAPNSKSQKIEQGNENESEKEEDEEDEKSDAAKSEWTPRRKLFAGVSCLVNLLDLELCRSSCLIFQMW